MKSIGGDRDGNFIKELPVMENVVGKRGAFPLNSTHSSHYFAPRTALIGFIFY